MLAVVVHGVLALVIILFILLLLVLGLVSLFKATGRSIKKARDGL
jgi:hypothetical protein